MTTIGLPATEIARRVRSGELDPREVVAEHLDRIAALDGTVGAFSQVRREAALAEAEALAGRADLQDLPLAGVPLAVKDNFPVAGEVMTEGSRATSRMPQEADDPAVARLRDAGAIVVGITRVPEFCVFGSTDDADGITHNPWDLSRTAGGSSGGSAAALAAGLVPLATGTDGMGSIRIPSACCGLVGIKPGFGTLTNDERPSSWYGLSSPGPIATTVADLALALAVMTDRPDLAEVPAPEPLRLVASPRATMPGSGPSRPWASALDRVATVFADAGHEVTRIDPPYSVGTGIAALMRWTAGTAAAVAERAEHPERLQRRTRAHAAIGRRLAGRINPEQAERWRRQALRFLEPFDALMTPGLARFPVRAARWSQRGWVANYLSCQRYAPFAFPWNLAGFPAMVVPAGLSEDGLPLSVQLVGVPGSEQRLLQTAQVVEQSAPWPRHAAGWVS